MSHTRGILEDRYPSLYERLENFAQQQSENSTFAANLPIPQVFSVGAGIVAAISDTIIVMVITAYLLLDGARIYRWSVRYLPDKQEAKVRQAMPEISQVVSGYLVGQVVTSLLFGIFTFAVLSIASVPRPLFLALLAAILDAVPIVGVFIRRSAKNRSQAPNLHNCRNRGSCLNWHLSTGTIARSVSLSKRKRPLSSTIFGFSRKTHHHDH